MTTTVINIDDAPQSWRSNPKYQYIGGPQMDGDIEFSGDPFATTFSVPKNGDAMACWQQYRDRLFFEPEGEELCHKITEQLTGTVLVCDCKSDLWCHGHILVEVAEDRWHFQGAVLA